MESSQPLKISTFSGKHQLREDFLPGTNDEAESSKTVNNKGGCPNNPVIHPMDDAMFQRKMIMLQHDLKKKRKIIEKTF